MCILFKVFLTVQHYQISGHIKKRTSSLMLKQKDNQDANTEVNQQSYENEAKNKSVSKIIESYQQLMRSLNDKIKQLNVDLELTREKLELTQTRYAGLLDFLDDTEKLNIEKMLSKIDELQKKLVNQTAEMNRYKAKLYKHNLLHDSESNQNQKIIVERSNLSNFFNFETIREDENIISRKRKNSSQEHQISVSWEKALEQFAHQQSSPTKFKEKTVQILKKFIPHQQRCKIWPYIFENQLGLNNALYIQLLQRKMKNPIEQHVQSQIQRDITRSFNCKIEFSNKQILKAEVQQILEIFHLFRPDISYVQGMTYPVIILTIVVGKIEAFKIFSNLILCNKFFRNMYTFQNKWIDIYCKVFESLLRESFPDVAKHLQHLKIKPQLFLIEWFFTIFSRGMSLETTLKIWDMLGYQRQVVLYRICLAIFQIIGKRLLTQNYQQTVGLIQSYWSYVDENKLLEFAAHSKLTNEKLAKLFAKITKQMFCKDKESQKL